ncbi:MetQ/NlpA family ABC transporter substrate-binding protein [Sporolactobacillus laevolacticus]|uniref:Lipoprotein n=1 Tax=Sporolactobacillus laevolacticus DSM 442 TaxID=1395513 RepID=V6IY75_9BACL|nr:MetQ/NlpA family ABC transporter substrate-binding protein [Sporolactobacillus laevolacticus]EST12357.1 dioxygenase [Sporolactobacillus laevolacticus DSM 442]MDN3955314.1 MetQ/NlpA family ABC transporter substrate-binding protein [Sporolactobacillus laevolacticus]
MKKITAVISALLAFSMIFVLAACGNGSSKGLSDKEITVGVTGGPHQIVMEQVAKLAKKDGLTIHLKVFNDYNQPNIALNEKELDANSYQTLPFLKNQIENKNYKITDAFKTVAFPMGIYSKSIKSLKDLKDGDKIAVPNDPANELRGLQLFEKAGVIKLKKGSNVTATKRDVVGNPKHLQIVEMDAAQLPAQLNEVAASAINTNFAMGAGLTVLKDSIFHEPLVNNPYPNYFVVRTANKNDKVVKQIQKYYHSKEVKDFIKKKFGGSVVPAW